MHVLEAYISVQKKVIMQMIMRPHNRIGLETHEELKRTWIMRVMWPRNSHNLHADLLCLWF